MPIEPLYVRIANQLLEQISSGVYAIGDVLPTEIELASQLQVSRHTLRAALEQMEKDGRISRRKNAGTRVEPLRAMVYSQSLGTVDELVQWAKRCQRQVQSSRQMVMDRAMAAELGCEPGSRWLKVTSLRFDDVKQSMPVALTQAFIDER
jgi:GntR family transcriptional regulator